MYFIHDGEKSNLFEWLTPLVCAILIFKCNNFFNCMQLQLLCACYILYVCFGCEFHTELSECGFNSCLNFSVISTVTKLTQNTTLKQMSSLRPKDHLHQHPVLSCYCLHFWGMQMGIMGTLGGQKICLKYSTVHLFQNTILLLIIGSKS